MALHFPANGLTATPFAGTVSAAALAAVALVHYRWCRRHAPPAHSPFFESYDTEDLGGVVTLLAALTCFFFLLRGIAWRILAGGPGGPEAFECTRSIIINLAALGLGYYAFRARNREIRNVAILVIAVGAVTSASDLLGTKGVPLVVSILSFGLAAATQSITLSRWQRVPSMPAPESLEPDKETA
jgi:hypothetical protein